MTDNKFTPGQVKALAGLIDYQDSSIVSRMLLNKPNGSVTLFALAEGQTIAEHTTPYDAMVNVIEGEAEIIISSKNYNVKAGEVLVMPANDPHALKAVKAFKMVLTMVK
ncbi:MAG: cupin domain-containing protein [Candidatus Margulisbacteria bacterium]|nr:cupin domain-containing protein [Candidatus Margulisiibacteriota bacterium]MBU1021602.1 cupin domain-containing protein [Candidatus Margulisiibacteriota bacterium]MBU1728753.1 cupin domain-containing protein [Candidatus Margulisiibacteriota bacterium]MBU1955719.1 cupin domain-containing protein [Candidatus Margulisiibacteriota bacterium]